MTYLSGRMTPHCPGMDNTSRSVNPIALDNWTRYARTTAWLTATSFPASAGSPLDWVAYLLLAMFYNIFDTVPERPVVNTDNLYFVLDGGSLIHRVVWPKQETFCDVYTTCMSYIKRHYGDEVTVVFGRYTENSVHTKVIECQGYFPS
ncbi:hypothetical protein AVEN_100232-1 [Araneus ventricosus]|uniref:Uncharacterized protein n=1 Tax=Araneus ventricosus TaxID=182803 RepID=A0A4Y2UW90_ARAVE|nr:hypothetical protein AVEN_100232-1 [Araneus ventricosus]